MFGKITGTILVAVLAMIFSAGMFLAKAEAMDADGDIVVIVDPGHGGGDSGAVSATTGDYESQLNWNIATALKAELETYAGVKVYLTRGSGEWQSNSGRGRSGENIGGDLFICVHNNSYEGSTANGAQVYGTVHAEYKAAMQSLAGLILQNISALGIANGGYQCRYATNDASADFYTALDEAAKAGIPGMIIEHCYLSHSGDAAFVHELANQRKLGAADAAAIAQYYGLSKRTVDVGGSLTLIRTYSAQINGSFTSYSSSDESVAYVSSTGLITAVGAGSATITCKSDGGSKTVKITVPEVTLKGIFAGVNPTFMNAGDVANYASRGVMVKAVYSDGSATQLSSGYTFGSLTDMGNGAYNVPVSYGGVSGVLRIYGTGELNYSSAGLNNPTSSNTDILVIPENYSGSTYSGGGTAVVTPAETEPETEPATVTKVEAVVSENHQVGDVLTGADFTITVTYSDGSTVINPEGWSATPLELMDTDNTITVTYQDVSCEVNVEAVEPETEPVTEETTEDVEEETTQAVETSAKESIGEKEKEDTTETKVSSNEKQKLNSGLIIAIAVVAVLLVGVIVAIVLLGKRRRKMS